MVSDIHIIYWLYSYTAMLFENVEFCLRWYDIGCTDVHIAGIHFARITYCS